jgi:hypothetical protein
MSEMHDFVRRLLDKRILALYIQQQLGTPEVNAPY